MEQSDNRGNYDIDEVLNEYFIQSLQLEDESVKQFVNFGSISSEGAKVIRSTNDGGYLVLGHTFLNDYNTSDILVLKVDENFKPNWTKTYGGKGTEYGNDIIVLGDGCLITGYTTSHGSGSKDVYVIKTDLNGNVVWSKTYGAESWDVGTSVVESENGFMICGFTNSFGAGEEDIYLINIDKQGNEHWYKTFGGERSEISNSICNSKDGGFVISASTGTFGGRNCDIYLIKVDEDGNEIWANNYPGKECRGRGFDWGNNMIATTDGGYAIVGNTTCNDLMDVFVIKIDADGNEEWQSAFGNNFYDYGYGIYEMEDESLIITGSTKLLDEKNNSYHNNIFAAKLGVNGEVEWSKSFGSNKSDVGYSLTVSEDGGIVISGFSDSFGGNSFELLLMKISM